MKKAKIMLTTLAILAVVGGAVAFKAQKAFDGNLKCSTLPRQCTVETYTIDPIAGTTTLFCTELDANPTDCTSTYKVRFDD